MRANELASLTALLFDFQANPPTVTVEAASEKSGRGATLPLHPFAADKVSRLLASRQQPPATPKIKSPIETLWPGTWSKKAAEMFRRDLGEAGSIWLAEVEKITDEHERQGELQRRTDSSFLKPENSSGETADFHALRHTFITMLASSGVHPKVAQQLARHSTITLTMDRYSHTRLVGLNAAVENLPSLARPERLMLDAATDTRPTADPVAAQDNPSVLVARRVAVFGDVSCENGVTADETPLAQPLSNEPSQRTRKALKIRASANDCGPVVTGDKPVSALGLEPRTYGLKVRCSTN